MMQAAVWAEPLKSLVEVRALSVDEASAGLEVEVSGVVLGMDPGLTRFFFLHDGEAGCYVKVREDVDVSPVPGNRVVVKGRTDPMGFYPSIRSATVRILGTGTHPEPLTPGPSGLFVPELDSAWVEVPVVITGYESGDERLTLSLEVHGQPYKAELPMAAGAAESAADLMLRPARLRGVMGTIFNRERQMTDRHFFVPSMDFILPEPGFEESSEPERRRIGQLLTRDTGPDLRVRIRGIITQVSQGGFYLRDESGCTWIQAGVADVRPGDEVDVDGFAAVAPYRPILRAFAVGATGNRDEVGPVAFDSVNGDLTRLHAELVSLDADYLGSHPGTAETILQFSSRGRFFEALLPFSSEMKDLLKPGDRVNLVGICELTTTHALPRMGWVDGFRLHLPSEGGIVILHEAPWWNTRRLFAALGLMSGVALLGFLVSWMLRRQVKGQLAVIGQQLRAEAVGEERDRMARELHDTLEQQLSGVALQLDSLDHAIRENPAKAMETLFLARRMLRFTRTEARRSVWDLRSALLENDGLEVALREVVESASKASGIPVDLEISGHRQTLPPRFEFHLLRISQEAVTNAIKHSKASGIRVHLDYRREEVVLKVSDDGVGFDSTGGAFPGGQNFGLLGMRERAARIGSRLEVFSSPGQGCVVMLSIKLEARVDE
jgi:signal transduction histidine kinase